MALTSPGVEVSIIDQSQYLPAPTGSVPLVVLATAQNKADPNGIGVAQATTAANAGKLFEVTSQRDLTTLYGVPFFYTTTNGTPIQGYELNEYGLLAAYSLLGVTNRCYVLRADIDLASLVGQTGRPVGAPDNGTYWLDATTSTWGIFEFDETTGQFTEQSPVVITDSVNLSSGVPLASIGSIGDYAVVAIPVTTVSTIDSEKTYYYKTTQNAWTPLGSPEWMSDVPTVISTATNPSLVAGTFTITLSTGTVLTVTITPGNTISNVVTAINNFGVSYVSAAVRNGRLCIFSSQNGGPVGSRSIQIASGTAGLLTALGIPAGTYYQPSVAYGTSAQMPLWTSSQTTPMPTGSVWIKIGNAGGGLNSVLSQYNSSIASWVAKTVTMSTSDAAVNLELDPTGGQAIPAGTIYGQYNFGTQLSSVGTVPVYYWERIATGPTVVTGTNTNPNFDNGPYTFLVTISVPNSSSQSTYTVTLADNSDATDFVTAWYAAGIPFTTAAVTTSGAIQITHTEGGSITIDDNENGVSTGLCLEAGFVAGTTAGVKFGPNSQQVYNAVSAAGGSGSGCTLTVVRNNGVYNITGTSFNNAGSGYTVGDTLYVDGSNLGGVTGNYPSGNNLEIRVITTSGAPTNAVTSVAIVSGQAVNNTTVQLSNWVEFSYFTPNEGAPVAEPANNTNWFYSVTDEVDIMVNYNGNWRGYKNQNYDTNGFPTPTGSNATDPNGPIVSATAPTSQSDATALVYGDLWISTADLENYPVIYRWQLVDGADQWVLLNNTDQTSSEGIVFADARWATNGVTSVTDDPIPTIVSLLTSNYLDLDAPSSALYPTGMLLFNTRRSGYNVKQFRSNYFNTTNFPGASLPTETNAWVSQSGLQSNGAPYMGRKAQRAMVVQSLRSAIDTNLAIRDEDNFFNLMAAPNYPELQPNMITLNSDRGETGFIIGDTPLGLSDNATAIQNWATNAAGATSTGEEGLVNRSSYMGLFYPSGLATDLSGNLVAVPASHMMLRTFLRNDTVAYPWLAAAGTRRGIIDNAANIGYVDRTTGEFVVIKTRVGVRDVLYTNFINPLVFFTGNGLLNYGNKSSFNSQSALDRCNVARLVAYIRRQLTLAGRPFVFEPNDALTRQQIAGVIESLMVDLVAKRGIYDYLVVCDESNNTPARIDRNELWVDVAVEPVKAAEFIYIPVRILNTGELGGA
jgi:hypothetical protein